MLKKIIFFFGIFFAFFLVWVFFPLFFAESPNFSVENTQILDRNGKILWTVPKKDLAFSSPISFAELDQTFVEMLIAKEDENFWNHFGVSVPQKTLLLWKNLWGTETRGGSTLTEQWIKNKYFLKKERNFPQKIREALLAFSFSLVTSKEKILEEYCSFSYFGNGAYGVKSASEVYFQKNFSELNFLEKAFLITLLSQPNNTDHLKKNFDPYQKYFLELAKKNAWLEEERIEAYSHQKLIFPEKTEEKKLVFLTPFFDFLSQKLQEKGVDMQKGGEKISTTIDALWQKKVEDMVASELFRLRENNVQDAGVLVMNAKTGEILVWVGTARPFDENAGKINTVLVPRPMASTIKPFLYLFHFLSNPNAHPRDIISDKKISFPLADGTEYAPQNFDGKEFGDIALEEALANSANISAVKILNTLGVQNFYDFLHNIGFSFPQNADFYGLSLALGTAEASVFDVAKNFSIFVNEGKTVSPQFFLKEKSPFPSPNQDFSPFKIQNSEFKIPLFYVRSALSSDSVRQRVFRYAGGLSGHENFMIKTGTSANFRDNWGVAVSSDFVVVVWTGNLDNSKMKEVSGVDGAGKILIRILDDLQLSGEKISVPETLQTVRVCAEDAKKPLLECAETVETTVKQ